MLLCVSVGESVCVFLCVCFCGCLWVCVCVCVGGWVCLYSFCLEKELKGVHIFHGGVHYFSQILSIYYG